MSKGPWERFVDVYEFRLHLAVTRKQLARLRAEMPDSIGDDAHEAAASTTHVQWVGDDGREEMHVVVWVDRKVARASDQWEVVENVAHESAHVSAMVCAHYGVETGGEAQAYLTGWAAGWIWRHVAD